MILTSPCHLARSTESIFKRNHLVSNTISQIGRPPAPALHGYHTKMDYSSIQTPAACYADFCLIPVGTGSVSVAKEVAEVQKLLKVSGLTYTMHSAGTTVEGSWDEVFKVIGQAHALVHQTGCVRVQSSMRVGTRYAEYGLS